MGLGPTTPTTISLSWTSAGSEIDSYEVMWERDISGECFDVDEGSTTITGDSTSYAISRLQEDSNYTITVTATNAAGSEVSVPVTAVTEEAGERIVTCMNRHTLKSYLLLQLHLPLPLLLIHLM